MSQGMWHIFVFSCVFQLCFSTNHGLMKNLQINLITAGLKSTEGVRRRVAQDSEENISNSTTDNVISDEIECPPSIVSSYEEILHYAPCRKSRSRAGKHYACEGVGTDMVYQTLCEGDIDESIPPPACSKNITSCDDLDYFSVCEKPPDEDYHEVWADRICGSSALSHNPRNKFACWDKELDHWCEGYIEPSHGSFEDPVCPSTDIRSVGQLESYGISSELQCTSNTVDGEGYFECERDTPEGAKEVWCEGFISSMSSACEEDAKDARGHPSCHTTNLRCPPPVVSSFDVVQAYCTIANEASAVMDKVYICKEHDNDEISCRGLIDVSATPPIECTKNITSCPVDYYELARDEDNDTTSSSVVTLLSVCDTTFASPFDTSFLSTHCNSGNDTGASGEEKKGPIGTFQCWDKIQQEYCLGYVTSIEKNEKGNSADNVELSGEEEPKETTPANSEAEKSEEDQEIHDTLVHDEDLTQEKEEQEPVAKIDFATESGKTATDKSNSSHFPFWIIISLVIVGYFIRQRSPGGGSIVNRRRNVEDYTYVDSVQMEMT